MKAEIQNKLISLSEPKYKEFISSLMPMTDKDSVLGVRVPQIRKLSKMFSITDFKGYDYEYHEEKLLHAFVIADIKDFDECILEVNKFLMYIDNWAICDSLRPKCFKKNTSKLINYINDWINSEHTYTIRFGIGMLMCHYLDNDFSDKYLRIVSDIRSDEYYVNMMVAWYFATALTKQYEKTIAYFEKPLLDKWVHNKAIQKAIESYRVPEETKDYLRTLRH